MLADLVLTRAAKITLVLERNRCLAGLLVLLAFATGCGSSASGDQPNSISSGAAKTPRTAVGRHKAIVHCGIAFGQEAEDIVVPDGVGKQIHTAAQWDEANRMVVAMEEKLCKAATGKPCPV